MKHRTTIQLDKPIEPKLGEYYYDIFTGDVLIYTGYEWNKSWWITRSKKITRIADNMFMIGSEEFAVYVDNYVDAIGLKTIKCIGRKFSKPLYRVEDECELAVFLLYFSDFIVAA